VVWAFWFSTSQPSSLAGLTGTGNDFVCFCVSNPNGLQNATLIELKFRSTETVADRIVKCFGMMLLRPFHFRESVDSERTRNDALEQLRDFSTGRVVASLTHLQSSMVC
jgi:hypothetical protein